MAMNLARGAASGVLKVPLNAVKTSTDLANAGIVNTGKIGVGVLDIAGTAVDTTSTVSRNAMGMAADASTSARSINKHALNTVVNAAKTSEKVSGHLMDLTGDTTGAASKLASTSVTQSSNVAINAITTFAKASGTLLDSIDRVTTGIGNKLTRDNNTYKALGQDYQMTNFKEKLKTDFSNNIEDLTRALKEFVKSKNEFIQGRFDAYRAKKCSKGRLYGQSCTDPNVTSLLQTLQTELSSLNRDAEAMAVNIRSVSSEVASALVQVYIKPSQDLNVLRSSLQESLASNYEKATDMFNTAVGSYTLFEARLIKEFEQKQASTMETAPAAGGRRTVRKKRRKPRRTKTGKRRLR
jgi:hypothetical protein